MKHPSSSLVKKDLLFAALRHEETPAIPWVPFAGVHAGSLKGYHARQFLTDEKKLVDALLDVNRQYDPDGQPVVFDLQIEAEILGCELVWAEKSPPSVATHPLAQSMELPTRLPEKTDGRLQNSLDREQVEEWLEILASDESPMPQQALDIDYDRYAAGEAHFAWVDREFCISLKSAQDWTAVSNCIQTLCCEFSSPQYRVAHLKMLLDDGETRLKCNLTALDHYEEKLAQFQEAIQKMHTLEATLRINAMLEAPLQSVEDNLDKIIGSNFRAATISYRQLSGFTRVPGYPKPTMRMIN